MSHLKGKYVYHIRKGWMWKIVGVGPRRLIGRYLMTGSRKYLNRRVFERYLVSGVLSLHDSMERK